jgi:hypothetical protein
VSSIIRNAGSFAPTDGFISWHFSSVGEMRPLFQAVAFHNFDFAPGKNFVQNKSRRRRREAVQRAGQSKSQREISFNVPEQAKV